ncbi:hypothetical protein [Herbiconiux sp.]|jgi:hypothetical protein|uniref:hypothetical protein n=1 Tax=Herbiconiux sp. TaxID=1871186 RepID=UPI0025C49DDC|nr:hypothetical protein [Herbiconiux sp.]
MDDLWPALAALAPTVLIGLVFWFVMRALIRSDKAERRAKAKIEAQERARLGLPAKASAE